MRLWPNRFARALSAMLVFTTMAVAQSVRQLDEFVVTATRTPQPPQRVTASATALDAITLQATPAATVDSVLRSVPSFSLFRRSDSLTANPTTQGVSLRGLGPSGASRSLVLLDGVPLNDPFGGWVNWSQLPRDALARIEVVPGGGASAWGNSALGGVLQLFSRRPNIPDPSAVAPFSWVNNSGAATAMAGAFATRSFDAVVAESLGRAGSLQLSGEDFTTGGFSIVAPPQRGAIDVPAWSRHRSWSAQWSGRAAGDIELAATARGFEELRGNGTPYQRNGTRSRFASVQAEAHPGNGLRWTAIAYVQDQTYASTFSSINATRTAETPASDQFAVPANAAGVSWSGLVRTNMSDTSFGVDARTVHGETRENYSYASGGYTRQRVAGGEQAFAGAFLVHQLHLTPTLDLSLAARVDHWADTGGHRWELVRATGAVTRDDRYANRDGTPVSPSAGIVWEPAAGWRVHASAQHSFRRPTLNELYRPFRQGTNVTEANPNLRTETADTAEAGVEWRGGESARPALSEASNSRVILAATAFWNELHDAVTNVTLARGPGTFPLFGALPAGGVGRQRLNVDRVRVQGAEVSATVNPSTTLSFTAALVYDDARVEAATVAPTLVGKRLPEVPHHTAALSTTWRAPARLVATSRVRWIGRQFDDDENSLRLGEAVIVDLGLSRPVSSHFEVFLNAENLTNARVETARTADGILSTGTPRFVFGGVRARW